MYVVERLALDLNDSEAGDVLLKEMDMALNDKWRNWDNLIHNQVHP